VDQRQPFFLYKIDDAHDFIVCNNKIDDAHDFIVCNNKIEILFPDITEYSDSAIWLLRKNSRNN
jgi:hypothetical protein